MTDSYPMTKKFISPKVKVFVYICLRITKQRNNKRQGARSSDNIKKLLDKMGK